MISYEYETTRSYNYDNGPKSSAVATVMFKGKDYAALKSLPNKLHNGARGYCVDWDKLDDETKSKIPGKTIIYDAEADEWNKL